MTVPADLTTIFEDHFKLEGAKICQDLCDLLAEIRHLARVTIKYRSRVQLLGQMWMNPCPTVWLHSVKYALYYDVLFSAVRL